MTTSLILALSVAFQVAAAALALWLTRITGRRSAWLLIAAAIALMAVRRAITVVRLVAGDVAHPPDPSAEVVALFISVVLLAGLALMVPTFRSMAHSERTLRDAQGELERRAAERTADLLAANARLQREVARRTELEVAQRETEQRVQAILDHSPAVIYVKDLHGRYILVNRRHTDLFHVSPVDVVGRTDYEVFPPANAEAFRANDAAVIEAGHAVEFEESAPQDDGLHIYISLKFPLRDTAGRVYAVCGISTDITDRKLAEEALRSSEHRLLTIFGSAPIGMVICGPDGEIVDANRAFQAMLGRSEGEIRQQGVIGLTHPDDAERSSALMRDIIEGRRDRFDLEKRYVRKDGREVLSRTAVAGIRDRDGNMQHFVAMIEDITARKEFERELLRSSSELARLAEERRTLLENTRDFLYRHDVDGVFTYVSPAAEQITGYSVAEWSGHYTTYLTDNPINADVIRHTEETLRTGRESPPYLVEVRHRRGHPIILEVNEKPYYEGDRIAGIIGVARDVTERVHAESELKKAKEAAESASRAKSVFLANMSHEIRTPIMALLGAAELSDLAPPADDRSLDYREIILRNGAHLLSLIDNLLDVARMESGTLEARRVECSLLDIMADVQAVIAPLRKQSAVDFQIRWATPIPERIQSHPTRLTQAVVNLVSNALKFTDAGHVHVVLAVDRRGHEPRLRIRVEDTGIGIDPAAQEEIFRTFARTDNPAALARGGLGLGLPLARDIAARLGGDIHVESEPGHGSVFTLRVATGPVDDVRWIEPADADTARAKDVVTPFPSSPVRFRGNILLAEDYRDTRELIRSALVGAGASVTAVENGHAALEQAANTAFDLILLDIRMPRVDGLEAAAELRRRGCAATLVALTASTAAEKQDEAIAAGFDEVWAKPIEMDRLVQLVEPYMQADSAPAPTGRLAPPASVSQPRRADARHIADELAAVKSEFIEALPSRVESIRRAIASNDIAQADELLHQLAGAGGMFGFMPISDEAARLRRSAQKGEPLKDPERLATLESLVAAAVAANHQPVDRSSS